MKNTILVTGGYGLIGTGIQKYIEKNKNEDNFIFLSSNHCDLRNINDTRKIFNLYKPNYVIHLAAKVGGLYLNMRCPVELYRDNIIMNDNIMELCKEFKVKKLISCLSTCVFPDKTTYPIDETMIHSSPPHLSNEGYSYAKRMIDVMNRAYNRQYDCNFTSIIPTNVYGENDNFNLDDSHVLPALIRRFVEASESDFPSVSVWGSGSPLREFLHVDDFASAVLLAYHSYDSSLQLNIGTGEEVSIQALASKVASAAGFQGKIDWDLSKPDGTPRKVLDATRIKALGWRPTIDLEEGIKATIEWYRFATFRGEVRK